MANEQKREQGAGELQQDPKLWETQYVSLSNAHAKARRRITEIEAKNAKLSEQVDCLETVNVHLAGEVERLRAIMAIYCSEELGNMCFETDQECVDYFMEFCDEECQALASTPAKETP